MDLKRFYELLAKKRSGEYTLLEQKEFMEWIQAHPWLQELDEDIQFIYDQPIYENGDTKKILNRVLEGIQDEKVATLRKPYKKWLAIAASLLIITSAYLLYVTNSTHPQQADKQSVVVTKKGSKTFVELPDGTAVWLNADSKLTYNKDFEQKNREVFLSGEAYFKVAKQVEHQFIIHTSTMDIKVLGTVFNVKAYPTDTHTEATLMEGSIEAVLKNTEQKILLQPNEKLTVRNSSNKEQVVNNNNNTPIIQVSEITKPPNDTAAIETAWTTNRLAFQNEKLPNIVPLLERWYNKTILVKKLQNPARLYNGSFNGDALEDVLHALQLVGGFNYTQQKDTIIIF